MTELVLKEKIENIFYLKNDWLNLNFDINKKKAIFKYFPIFKTDMYFYYIFRLILINEYEQKGIAPLSKNDAFNKFIECCGKILKEKCAVLIPEYDNSYNEITISFPWTTNYQNYSNEVDLLKNSVLNIVNHKKEIKNLLGINESENPYFSELSVQYFQNLMFIGYNIAKKRVYDELENKNFFGLEVVDYSDEKELIFYLTPFGMLNLNKLFEKNNDEIVAYFYDNIKEFNASKVNNEQLKKDYNTKTIIFFNNNIYIHKNFTDLDFNSYMNKRLNRFSLNLLYHESQLNLKKI